MNYDETLVHIQSAIQSVQLALDQSMAQIKTEILQQHDAWQEHQPPAATRVLMDGVIELARAIYTLITAEQALRMRKALDNDVATTRGARYSAGF